MYNFRFSKYLNSEKIIKKAVIFNLFLLLTKIYLLKLKLSEINYMNHQSFFFRKSIKLINYYYYLFFFKYKYKNNDISFNNSNNCFNS